MTVALWVVQLIAVLGLAAIALYRGRVIRQLDAEIRGLKRELGPHRLAELLEGRER